MEPFRIAAIADSDSYLKFACATLDTMSGWDRSVAILRSPLRPTVEQMSAAAEGTFLQGSLPPVLTPSTLTRALACADVVLSAATGPVTEEVFLAASRLEHRPALISALPGVALPATSRALQYRALGDAFITHSHAECRAFSAMATSEGLEQTMLVSRLPFLRSTSFPEPVTNPLRSVVFAPQAKVPSEGGERSLILQRLAALSRRHPELDVVVKLRAWDGEPQTHLEQYPYDRIWATLISEGAVAGHELSFRTGPMSQLLVPGAALVTVSSTAALEAVDAGLPVLVLDDFGVSDELLNSVFTGSGLLGSLKDLGHCAFSHPTKSWLRENYFHHQNVDLAQLLESYAARARAGRLEARNTSAASARYLQGRIRRRLRTALPTPLLHVARRIRSSA